MKPSHALALTLLGLLSAASAHICILEPHQRGDLSIEMAGDPTCYRRTDYCGGISAPSEAPATNTYVAGQRATILWQQNLNHFYIPKQGFFDLSIASVSDLSSWSVLATLQDWPATDMVFQSNHTMEVVMPAKACEHCVLRLRYVSYNPLEVDPSTNTDAIFYNCADIRIVPSGVESAEAKLDEVPQLALTSNAVESTDASCETPKQWHGEWVEVQAAGRVIQHSIWYDATIQQVRWDRVGELEASGQNATLQLFTNYTRPVEFVYTPSTKKCLAYGNDVPMVEWQYGPKYGQVLANSRKTTAGDVIQTWTRKGSDITFVTKTSQGETTCTPVSRGSNTFRMTNVYFKAGPVDTSVFTPPSVCTTHHVQLMGGSCGPNPEVAAWLQRK